MTPKYTFGQREAGWAGWPINNTASTIGRYGCTLTAYGIALGHYLGKSVNPKESEIFIRDHGAFLGDLVNWTKLPYFRWRFYCAASPAPLEDIRNELRAGKMVLLSVDLVGNDDKPDHWVLCLDENFTIFDPWYNEIAPITKRYGNPAREIFGGAYFNWPTPPAPTPIETKPKLTMEEIFSNIFIAFFERWPNAQEMAEFKDSADFSRPYTYVQNKWLHDYKNRKDFLEGEVERLYKSERDKDEFAAKLQGKIETLQGQVDTVNGQVRELAEQVKTLIEEKTAGLEQAYNDGKAKGFADGVASVKPVDTVQPKPVLDPNKSFWQLLLEAFRSNK